MASSVRLAMVSVICVSLGYAGCGTAPSAQVASAGESAATSPAHPGTPLPEVIDRGAATPKELLETLHTAYGQKGGPPDLRGFMPPASRGAHMEGMEGAESLVTLTTKAREVASVVTEKIGRDEGDYFKRMTDSYEEPLQSPLNRVVKDGKVDWDKVKITEKGGKATALLDANPAGGGTILPLAKVDGKWYLDVPPNTKESAETSAMVVAWISLTIKDLDKFEQKVKTGKITKKNFHQECDKFASQSAHGFDR